MNKNVEKLVQLAKENPDLPIIPLVDSDVVCEDSYNSWIGSFGEPYVGEYAQGEEHYYFDVDELIDELADEYYEDEEWAELPDEEFISRLRKIAKEQFQKAIFVWIGTPDE